MTDDERARIAEEAAQRALQQGRREFAQNGWVLWIKLIGAMALPVSVGLVGYGELRSTVNSIEIIAGDNREAVRELEGKWAGYDHRLRTIEERIGAIQQDFEELQDQVD